MDFEAALFQAIAKHDGKTVDFDTASSIVRDAAAAMRSSAIDKSYDPSQFQPFIYGPMTFQAERMRDIADEMRVLHEQHWQETEAFRHDIELNFDYERVIAFERDGRYIVFTMRRGGELVGASGLYIDQSVHSKTHKVATEDTIYLLPQARRGWVAKHFLDYINLCIGRIGVREVYITTKLANKASILFERYGCEHIGNQYVYIIKGSP